MEMWEHDAFLGYMAEEYQKSTLSGIVNDIENDIIFHGYDEDDIVDKYGPRIGEDNARRLFGQLS